MEQGTGEVTCIVTPLPEVKGTTYTNDTQNVLFIQSHIKFRPSSYNKYYSELIEKSTASTIIQ